MREHILEGMKWGDCSFMQVPEPVCPNCGHKVIRHDEDGCHDEFDPLSLCRCKRTPSNLQPKECDHLWEHFDGFVNKICKICGRQEKWQDERIRPQSLKVQEKHCSKSQDYHNCNEYKLRGNTCDGCDLFILPVEPAEKQYIVSSMDGVPLDVAKRMVESMKKLVSYPFYIGEIIEWHEEQ